MNSILGIFSNLVRFLRRDVWRLRVRDASGVRGIFIRALRVLVLTVRGLTDGRWALRASALTYYSLLSVVPALALAFGLAKGFGLEKSLQRVLYENLRGQEEILNQVTIFAQRMLENVKGGLMAVVSLVLLFWACFRLLSQVEAAFNEIWGVSRGRPPGRRVADYLAVMIVAPFLLVLAGALNVFISSELGIVLHGYALLEAVSPAIVQMVGILPYVAIWMLFSTIYVFMPHTRVQFTSGLLAGIIAGTIFQLFQSLYIKVQVLLSGYNAVYGSFAALPLFVIWLNLSWLILLFGAEISCAHQNADTYEFEIDRVSISQAYKRLLALAIVHTVIRDFADRDKDLDATDVARSLELPIPLANQILFELVQAGVLSEVRGKTEDDVVYHPALDPDMITVMFVIEALERRGEAEPPVTESPVVRELAQSLQKLGEIFEASPHNRLLKGIKPETATEE